MPNAIAPGAAAREVADLRIVAVDDEHRVVRQRRGRRPPALGDVLELAVAVELVAEEVAEQDRARPDAAGDLRQRALVDLEQPQLGVALRRAASRRRPETRFAPELFQARRRRGPRISAAMAVVVVLPFVAETTAAPCGSRAASASIAPGSSFQSSLPGQRRAAACAGEARELAAARAASDSTARRALIRRRA